MSAHADRGGWIARWRDGDGRQRGKRFASEELRLGDGQAAACGAEREHGA
jgi:hypothetical protein